MAQINKAKSPNNYPFIMLCIITLFLTAVLILIITLSPLYFNKLEENGKVLAAKVSKTTNIQNDLNNLETLLEENPDYYPGWLFLSEIYKKNNNLLGSETALNKAKKIDPNGYEFMK